MSLIRFYLNGFSRVNQKGTVELTFSFNPSTRSITSEERSNPSPLGQGTGLLAGSSPVMAMDISPAPVPHNKVEPKSTSIRAPPNLRPLALFTRHASQPLIASATVSNSSKPPQHPFLHNLFRSTGQQSAPATQTTFPPIAPLSIPRSSSPVNYAPPVASTSSSISRPKKPRSRPSSGSSSGHTRRPSLTHYATVPPSQAEESRPPFSTNDFAFGANRDRDENQAPVQDGFFVAPTIEESLVSSRYPTS